ncbi:SGNH/GDSL hydrolase family protein [Flavobacterium sp.]|uniref:SGNH/GDSL hydrolase family protein n=1 Tax=Flavobacterium sp. TaxID=239 RepID=UPI00121142B5|nr:SGNH/GDSL hydrolase family protein [Flavobacterium sp.]RZJ70503.1 MAG: GDSL family lipase [Flavobacterium sp.]
MIRTIALSLFLLVSTSHQPPKTDSPFTPAGRTEIDKNGNVVLIGSGASVSFYFASDKCSVTLESPSGHNYVSVELDGKYVGRFRIEGESKDYRIPVKRPSKRHTIRIFKATEASNGTVIFKGAKADKITKFRFWAKKKVEFIGNSITCGMGNDAVDYPCGTGEWYDQHNAYWAYGPVLSRSLKFDFLLSSVSGIGMYRNWNDEHKDEANMPDVYGNLYLNKDSSKRFDNFFQPDVVSICLGTNDLSDGDGKKTRAAFDEKKYVENYIQFIKTVYMRYPKTRIILLTSPMVSGQKNATLVKCLKLVIASFKDDSAHKSIELFEYKPMSPKGCGNHPDISDHIEMAKQLEPVFNKLLE